MSGCSLTGSTLALPSGRSAHQEDGAAGPMHDPVRHATQHETIEPLPPVGADHDEVVALSHFAHGRGGIARANIGRHREVRAGQRLSRVLHDLFGIPLTLRRPAFLSHHQLVADIVERGKDRENGDRDGVLEGVRRQPRL